MLQAVWEHSPAEATVETREDWDALQRHLQVEPVRRNTVSMYRGWIKYAAVIALMLLTGAATFFVTDRLKPTRHVEMAELFVPYGESRQVILPDVHRYGSMPVRCSFIRKTLRIRKLVRFT